MRNDKIGTATDQNTATEAAVFEYDSPAYGEMRERPMAPPAVRSTNEIALAVSAPANTAPHST
jgi:hypothetical protein